MSFIKGMTPEEFARWNEKRRAIDAEKKRRFLEGTGGIEDLIINTYLKYQTQEEV